MKFFSKSKKIKAISRRTRKKIRRLEQENERILRNSKPDLTPKGNIHFNI